MKAALVGYGQMGHMIENLAPKHGIEIAARFWDEHPLTDDAATQKALSEVSVLIDFSVPEATPENIRKGIRLKKAMVVGTTGWYAHLDPIRREVEAGGVGLVYASNFSLGVNLFYRIVEMAGNLMASFDAYDPFIEESHHKLKKDAPSGTAAELGRRLKSAYGDRPIPIFSIRAGFIPGTHTVCFDSRVDTISLSHTARSREGFAEGALLAARWIVGKKGVYPFHEVLDDLLQRSVHRTNEKL